MINYALTVSGHPHTTISTSTLPRATCKYSTTQSPSTDTDFTFPDISLWFTIVLRSLWRYGFPQVRHQVQAASYTIPRKTAFRGLALSSQYHLSVPHTFIQPWRTTFRPCDTGRHPLLVRMCRQEKSIASSGRWVGFDSLGFDGTLGFARHTLPQRVHAEHKTFPLFHRYCDAFAHFYAYLDFVSMFRAVALIQAKRKLTHFFCLLRFPFCCNIGGTVNLIQF